MAPALSGGSAMRSDDRLYHQRRERHCRELAERAANPEVRRRHEELAALHAERAARYEAVIETLVN